MHSARGARPTARGRRPAPRPLGPPRGMVDSATRARLARPARGNPNSLGDVYCWVAAGTVAVLAVLAELA